MSMTVRMRANISKTSTGKYSGDVTVEFTEEMNKQLPAEAGTDKMSTYQTTDLLAHNLKYRLSEMTDWMEEELKARGGD